MEKKCYQYTGGISVGGISAADYIDGENNNVVLLEIEIQVFILITSSGEIMLVSCKKMQQAILGNDGNILIKLF